LDGVGRQLADDQLHVLDDGAQAVLEEMVAHKPARSHDTEWFGHERLLV
jgi:hypothetical protein